MAVVHFNERCRHNNSPLSGPRLYAMQHNYGRALVLAKNLLSEDEPLSEETQDMLRFLAHQCEHALGQFDAQQLALEAEDLAKRAIEHKHYGLAADMRAWLLEFYTRRDNQQSANAATEGFFDGGIPQTPGYVALKNLAEARLVAWRHDTIHALPYFERITNTLLDADPAAPCILESAARYQAGILNHLGRTSEANLVLSRAGVNPDDINPEVPYYLLERHAR